MNPNNANNNQPNPQWPTATNNFVPNNQPQVATQLPVNQNQPDPNTNPFLQKLNLDKYDKHLQDINNRISQINPVPVNNISQPFSQPNPISNMQAFQQIPQQVQQPVFGNPQVSQLPPINPPTYQQVPNAPLNPGILAQSLVQSENKSALENQMGASAVSPEVNVNTGNDAQTERAVENIVEQLKNVENSSENNGENDKVKSDDPKAQDSADVKEDVKDLTKAANSAIGKVKIYGYQLPQKLLNLASAGKLSSGISSDVSSTKTWLVALVGRIIQIKSLSD